MKHELRCLGPSLDHFDFNAWQYGDFFITLHLTAIGSTRIRLIQNREDPVYYRPYADWCCGNEPPKTGLFVLLGFCQFIDAIDNGYVNKLPHSSDIRPVWLDTDFKAWLLKHPFEFSKLDGDLIYQEIQKSNSRVLLDLAAKQVDLRTNPIPWDDIAGSH